MASKLQAHQTHTQTVTLSRTGRLYSDGFTVAELSSFMRQLGDLGAPDTAVVSTSMDGDLSCTWHIGGK